MRYRLFIIRLLITAIIILPGNIIYGKNNLNSYVQHYNNARVSSKSLQKLARYNHLIDYFSSFSFFRPRHKVHGDFIRALILAESNVNPKAISPAKALGLGQIIHSTGKQAALELANTRIAFRYIDRTKLLNLKRKDLFDPAINILLTCYLISKYNYKFNGRLDLVLSAWNAGEYTKSLKKGRHAPYKETMNLIGKVNGYYTYLLNRKRKYSSRYRVKR